MRAGWGLLWEGHRGPPMFILVGRLESHSKVLISMTYELGIAGTQEERRVGRLVRRSKVGVAAEHVQRCEETFTRVL